LAHSVTCRTFCRIGLNDRPPKKATLQENAKRVKTETWEQVSDLLTLEAKTLGLETGRKVRTHCTVVLLTSHREDTLMPTSS